VTETNDTPDRLDTVLAAGRPAAYQEVTGVQPRFAAQAAAAWPSRDAGRAMRLVALVAVIIGLAALTAAACVLSYSSIHHLAIQAGVSARLASVYPLIFDALLILAGCSVLALRGARFVSRVYAWLCMLVLLGSLAAGGALDAAATKVPHRVAGEVAAIVPWVLVLIGFGLLLALLRYARSRRLGRNPAEAAPDFDADAAPVAAAQAVEAPAAEAPAEAPVRPTVQQAALQLRARIPDQPVAPDDLDAAGQPESELNPAPVPERSEQETGEPPTFRRTRSSPTPPQE
jgi:Protein of unknown function (DUF2637)